MKLAKKLACLALAGVIALAQVPVTALAATNNEHIYFDEDNPLELNDMVIGGTYALDVEGDALPGESLSFSSSNTSVVTVDGDGLLTIQGSGTSTVTATVQVATSSEASPSEATPSDTNKKYDASLKVKVTLKNGWDEGKDRYYRDGVPVTNEFIDEGETTYYINWMGYRAYDEVVWAYYDEEADADIFYYANGDGVIVKGDFATLTWATRYVEDLLDEEEWDMEEFKRYFDSDGIMVTSTTLAIGGKNYEFNSFGRIVREWTPSNSSSSSSSDSDSSSSGGGSGSNSGSSVGGGAIESPSGALVSSNTTTAADGSIVTTTTVSLGGKTMTIVDTVKVLANGATQRTYQVSGDVAGLTFAGVGTVSADGTTLTTPEGQTYMVTSAPMSNITYADGTTVGCFIDPVTGQPLAFGYDVVLMQLGADGQMHAHWIKADGTFYTGTVVMNGMMIVFNEEGVMVSYSALAM